MGRDCPISLLRTRRATLRWYLTTRAARATGAVLVVVALGAGVVWQWPVINSLVTTLAEGVVGPAPIVTLAPTPGPDVKDILRTQAELKDQLEGSKTVYDASVTWVPEPERAVFAEQISKCSGVLADEESVRDMAECASELGTATATVTANTKNAQAVKAAADDAARVAAEQAAAAEAARIAAEQEAANGGSQPAAPAPEPKAPAAQNFTASLTVNCSSSATVTFASSGAISVSGAGSGSGSGSVTVSGKAGTYYASATSGSAVSISASWSGQCTQ
ncbi:hypothetical protein [Rathayibacter rathayi]|uniref:Ig-like domain-containing protein n=1 Tax=Rathayibacter rathayi TaxID=33887 RepID=A0ABX5AF43_RATRA|nr:hypothetical protein [Rathayibacter rathayi]PPF23119.1 hypothetical protein C5C34_09830 [Rathayibacter rathayi]PPF51637.1 hypothetical protein C5C08_02190 [Rathayibacter rathayi]PPF83227.1 hypothetical protein C5C14_02225 [Rathayibacter rathayi]PPG14385.1 hypothetical protein C5C11_04940 [Rathayibacter rathayi]PPG47058.1 hypothetical protein C5C20_02185 [Rathayibacter rathayi]